MTDNSSDHCFTQSFINIHNGNEDMSNNIQLSSPIVQAIIGNRGIQDILSQTNAQTSNTCALYTTALPAMLGNLPEGTVFQLMPDSTILTTIQGADSGNETLAYKDLCLENRNEVNSSVSSSNVISIPNYTIGMSDTPAVNPALSNAIKFTGNLSDLDFSFLNETNEPEASSEEMQSLSTDSAKQFQQHIPDCLAESAGSEGFNAGVADVVAEQSNAAITDDTNTENTDTVLVDVTKPIQLSQNALIVVNGQKCILQQDPQTGQVIAYPVKESLKPKKKRGRPRKVLAQVAEAAANDREILNSPMANVENNKLAKPKTRAPAIENSVEEENLKNKGLLEIVNDDGSFVRRSTRKRKRAKTLIDYETGSLNPELGSDAEDNKAADKDDDDDRGRKKSRLKLAAKAKKCVSDPTLIDAKRVRGRPKKDSPVAEPTQSFLIQMADGQSMMMQVPLSNIPPGMSLQDVAQGIAENFNMQAQQANNSVNPPTESDNASTAETDTTNVSKYLNQPSGGLSLPMELDGDQLPVASQAMTSISEQPNNIPMLGTESNTFSTAALPTLTTTTSSHILKMAESLSKDDLSCILRTAASTTLVSSTESPQKNADDATTDFFSSANSITTTSQSINDKFPFNFMTDGELDGTFSMLSDHVMKDMSVLNKKLTPEEPAPAMTVVEDKTKETNKIDDALYKNSEIMDSFDFSFTDASELKDKSNLSFMQQCSQLINEKNSESDDTIVDVVDGGEMDNMLTPNQATYQNAITDHEYQSKYALEEVVNKSPAKEADSAISVLTLSDSQLLVQIENPIDNMACPTVQNDIEVSEGADNILPLCSEISSSNDKIETTKKKNKRKPDKLTNKLRARAYRKKKRYDAEPSILDVQNCMPTAIDVNAFPNMASLLNSEVQETSELNGGLAGSSTTVIPLSEKVLSMVLDNGGESSIEAAKKLICTKCGFVTTSYDEYKKHLSVHVKDVKRCKCCKYICLSEEEIISHYKENHVRCICSECNYMAEQPYVIKRHMLRHTGNGSTCEICKKVYKDHYIMKMHVKMVHMPPDTIFDCDVCGKQFNRRAHMKRHMRTHGTDKPYKCDHCDYRGTEKSDVTKHQLIHEDPKHVCDICGKTFRHMKNKDLHTKRHNNQRDFKCGACDFYGYTFTDIRKHIERKHRPGKNTCPVCAKTFKSAENLKIHMDTDLCEESMEVFAFDLPADSEIQLREKVVHSGRYDVIASVVTAEDGDADDPVVERVTIDTSGDKVISVEDISNLTSSEIININDMLNTSNQITIKGFDED